MKPVLVNRTSGRGIVETQPKLSINKHGSFYINGAAVKLIGENELEFLANVYQDEENKKIWYIRKEKNGQIKIKAKTSKTDKSAQAFVKDIADKMKLSVNHDSKEMLRFNILSAVVYEENKYYPIHVIEETVKVDLPKKDKPYEFGK